MKIIAPNENSNDFPDFILPDGFVEHFMITSSKENRKGSPHKIAKLNFNKENYKSAQQLSYKKPMYMNDLIYEGHTYANLETSFHKNWNNHIESLRKYSGNKKIGIFLVEYTDIGALSMSGMKLEGLSDENSVGDYPSQEKLSSYYLSRDREMLEWIYKFKNQIEYVIFITGVRVEIIKTSSILDLLTLLPYKYAVCPNLTILTDVGTLI